MLKQICAGGAAIVMLGTLAGCGGGEESSDIARERELENYAARYGVDVDVTVGDDGEVSSVRTNSAGGGTVGNNLDLPSSFPDDVVLHPSESIYAVNQGPGGTHMISAFSETAIADLTEWHRSEMQQRGWTEQPGGAGNSLSFRKGTRIASVSFLPNGDNVAVQITTMTIPG